MKKLIFILLILVFTFGKVNANWYGNNTVAYTSTSGNTSCLPDSETDSVGPTGYSNQAAATNTSSSLTPQPGYNNFTLGSYQSNADTVATSGNLYCLKWDSTAPTTPSTFSVSAVNNSDNSPCNVVSGNIYCKSSNITVNYNWSASSDYGGSTLKNYYVFLQDENINNVGGDWSVGTAKTLNYSGLSNYKTYKTFVRAIDVATNVSGRKRGPDIYIDTVGPTSGSISSTTNPSLLADDDFSYALNIINPSGAPIGIVEGKYENNNNQNNFTNFSFSDYNNASNKTITWNISQVDNYKDATYGGREYSFIVTRVCDYSMNCWTGTNESKYNVYANTTDLNSSLLSVTNTSNDISDGLVADGSNRLVQIKLEDRYFNAITSASGISRTIDLHVNGVNNTMYLDQYNRTGANSIYFKDTLGTTHSNTILTNGDHEFTSQYGDPDSGLYNLNFKFYTPTANSFSTNTELLSDPDAQFSFTDITFDVNGSIGNNQGVNINNDNVTAIVKSMFDLTISGDLNDYGLRAQTVQNGTFVLSKNSTRSVSSQKLLLKYTEDLNNTTGYIDKYTLSVNGSDISESDDILNLNSYTTNLNSRTDNITSYLNLDNPPAPSSIESMLSSHFYYVLDGHTVITNSDVIGKTSYHGAKEDFDSNQSGLYVLGETYSQDNITDVFSGTTLQSLGKIDKLDIATQMRSEIFKLIKSLSDVSTTTKITSLNSSGGGTRIGNDIIYLGDKDTTDSLVYTLGTGVAGSTFNVNGTKTIIVVGGDLYIRSNMYYSGDYNLGIIVLENENGVGGNLYIDPNVTNIVGTIYAQKSLISYNGTELDGTTDGSALANQLHIYGSVYSYNTIGGSSSAIPECPYYATSCTFNESIKYDLNYLRRYYLYTNTNGVKVPAYNGKVSGYGNCNSLTSTDGSCSTLSNNFAMKIQNTETDITTDGRSGFSKYGVIIEYNPNIKTQIPPFFDINN